MPKAFEEARKRGAKIRTITKGPNKGKLVAIEGDKLTMGYKRGH